ncbi:chloramphenicol acetyltransferase CAT [Lactiplantibacillus garii]|uniref:Chloramphenicol acetyltransferase CAT n=1 Tax=Lactiplantibacillus garii TaxID=2306423 RepID=A0A3R8KJ60_9LACO|nr:chloramphenicol acetyltransferase [Lactiplantibacillus garii]RRK10856.1 chloramphenicol acetyltransferase CAT [Lactiplantibacillus garii]
MTEQLNNHYTVIDQQNWPRQQYFYYFTKMNPTGFSLTVDLDITATLTWAHTHHVKFNAVYLYLVSQLLTRHPEMRVGYVNDQLVTFDVLHPSYTVIHADHSISNLWTAYDADFNVFYQRYLADLQRYGDQPGPMPKAPQSPNLVNVGSLPWVNFTSYTPLPFKPLDTFFPIFQAGQFKQTGTQTTMPLSLTINHATADGYHVSCFFNELQALFTAPTTSLA